MAAPLASPGHPRLTARPPRWTRYSQAGLRPLRRAFALDALQPLHSPGHPVSLRETTDGATILWRIVFLCGALLLARTLRQFRFPRLSRARRGRSPTGWRGFAPQLRPGRGRPCLMRWGAARSRLPPALIDRCGHRSISGVRAERATPRRYLRDGSPGWPPPVPLRGKLKPKTSPWPYLFQRVYCGCKLWLTWWLVWIFLT